MAGIFNQDIKSKFVQEFISDVSSTSSNYYVGFGNFFEWPDDNNPPSTNAAIGSIYYDVNSNLLFGKKITSSDIAFITRTNKWTSGTVYSYYDHRDPNLYSKAFYVVTSLNRVYKCLFNNYGAPSTIEPSLTINSGDFNTTDGYKWKYMFTVNSATSKKFATDQYLPIVPSKAVTQFAENGALHVLVVDNSGNNYASSNGYVVSSLDNYTFQISNTNASVVSGTYTDSTFYVYSGGGSGSLSPIKDYVVNSIGKFVSTTNPITSVDSTSLYTIGPQVKITGDGSGAAAVTNIDPATGSITSIDVVDRGLYYSYANVSIVANSFFGYGASVSAIISPRKGHGYDPISELGCSTVGISAATSLVDNFPTWVTYRQISLLFNPTAAANSTPYQDDTFNQMLWFDLLSSASPFATGEVVQGFNSKATATVAYMDANVLYVLKDVGTFQPYETLTSLTSGKTCVISAINNKDLVPYTSDVYYYKNIQPINRDGIASEDVKLYFNF